MDEKGLDFVVDSNDVIIGITESTEAMETTEAIDLKEIIRRMDERRMDAIRTIEMIERR